MDVLVTYWVVSSNKYRDQLWRHICNTQLTFGAMASFARVGGFFLERVQKWRILDDLKILDWVKMQISETCKQKSQIITVYWIRF